MSSLTDSIISIFSTWGVPAAVWQPIMQVESGGNPSARSVTGNEDSVGLFQLNRLGGLGAGYSVTQLQDPTTNASIAAMAMAPAYKEGIKEGLSGLSLVRYVAYNSGWPTTQGINALESDPVVQSYDQKLQAAVLGTGGSQTTSSANPAGVAADSTFTKIIFAVLGGGLVLLGVKIMTDVPVIIGGGGNAET